MYTMLFASPPPAERVPKWINYVDVRDVAELHIKALEIEEAGGQRIIANSGTYLHFQCNRPLDINSREQSLLDGRTGVSISYSVISVIGIY